ncbi:MAG: sterol desaturase family protein [Hyphomicrobiales bacterium]|nr:sterol desaturase family protein [Hyphomicrobiales bacterium]MCP5374314.1 sterol desaturase family protein [Hyphomicrobiales bacterium]
MFEYLEYFGLAIIPPFLLWDAFRGARSYRRPRFWRLRGLLVTVAAVALSIPVALIWADLTAGVSLLDLSATGTWWGALIGILVYEFGHYWYHRTAHRATWLWRSSHQMHHSAEAVDAFGAYFLHPIDVLAFTTLSSLVFFPLLGLTLEAGLLATAFLGFNAMFQHANIRTPHWLGYIIQRPESHCVHHGRGVHAFNYADLPLWDMVFGTFRNPRDVTGLEAGFYTGASARIPAMLAGRDVSEPAAPSAAPPAAGLPA